MSACTAHFLQGSIVILWLVRFISEIIEIRFSIYSTPNLTFTKIEVSVLQDCRIAAVTPFISLEPP
jgi:hypothetical protein